MPKILIIGAQGMLGQDLVEHFKNNNYDITAWDRQDIDITYQAKVKEKITHLKPEIIINTAAYTDVDKAEKETFLAMKINGQAVQYLAQAALETGAFLIHISTDYVFGSNKKEGYIESDVPLNPLNIYGKSKLLGEKLLLKEASRGLNFYILRISWLFGPHGKNFVETMLKLAYQKKDLRVVDDQYGKPTFTKDLAQTIQYMIENKLVSGIYHFTNEPALNWYQFAQKIFETYQKITPNFTLPKVFPVSSQEFSRPAIRPHYSILKNTKLPKGRDIPKVLLDYFQEIA
jgi:dTDP-4-dehydrorhamnose reductase